MRGCLTPCAWRCAPCRPQPAGRLLDAREAAGEPLARNALDCAVRPRRRRERQARSVGACGTAGPGRAAGPRVSPADPARASSRRQGPATAVPAGVCRSRVPGRETVDIVARWPCLTQVSDGCGACPAVPRAPLNLSCPRGPSRRGRRAGTAVLWLPHLCHRGRVRPCRCGDRGPREADGVASPVFAARIEPGCQVRWRHSMISPVAPD